jgi:hypothetical protein
METAVPQVRLGRSRLGAVRHVCAFFGSDEEAYRVLVPFILDGFDGGEKAVHVVRPDQERDHVDRLAAAGLDVSAVEAAGQLEIRVNTEIYLHGGKFDTERMLAAFERMATANTADGFPRSRIVCQMDSVIESTSTHNDVIEFESRVNDVWDRHDDIVICVYDLKKMRGDLAIDIMRTHPIVLIGDVLHENPFFIPPSEFLRERRGGPAS